MSYRSIARCLVVLTCALGAAHARADVGDILQPYTNASAMIQYYAPIGQSFTAVSSSLTTFGFRVQNCNDSYPNNPLTYSLYSGETASGTPLATRQVALPSGDNYLDADFSGVSLLPGQKYTMLLSATSSRGCVLLNGGETQTPSDHDYPGGRMVYGGTFYSGGDLTFRLIALPRADLLVNTLEVSADPVLSGSNALFQGALFNDGPGMATAVQASLSLSGPGSLLNVSSSAGSCTLATATSATCTLGDVAALANVDIGALVHTTGPGVVTLSLQAQGSQTDPVSGNNQLSRSLTAGPGANLGLQIGAAAPSLIDIAYADVLAVVGNAGPGDVAGARLQILVPGEFYLARWSCLPSVGAHCGSGGAYSIDDRVDVPAGGSVTYVISGYPVDYDLDGYLHFAGQVSGGNQVELDGSDNGRSVAIPLSIFRGDFEAE